MKTYQLGMEERYGAEALSIWINEGKPCGIKIMAAKAEGLIIVELTDPDIANKILLKTRCKVYIKNSNY